MYASVASVTSCSDCTNAMNHLATVVSDAMGRECRTVHLPPRNEVVVAYSDHAKAERVFGPGERIGLEDGIRRMAEWVEAHGARESSLFENIEIEKNLTPSWAEAARRARTRIQSSAIPGRGAQVRPPRLPRPDSRQDAGERSSSGAS